MRGWIARSVTGLPLAALLAICVAAPAATQMARELRLQVSTTLNRCLGRDFEDGMARARTEQPPPQLSPAEVRGILAWIAAGTCAEEVIAGCGLLADGPQCLRIAASVLEGRGANAAESVRADLGRFDAVLSGPDARMVARKLAAASEVAGGTGFQACMDAMPEMSTLTRAPLCRARNAGSFAAHALEARYAMTNLKAELDR